MVVKVTRSRRGSTRAIATPMVTPAPAVASVDPTEGFRRRVDEAVRHFHSAPVTPQRLLDFENELAAIGNDTCRQVLEREVNGLEPDDKRELPNKVRYHKTTYRINKKTPARVATRFGVITVRSFYYLNEEDGEPGLHPLRVRLGIGAGSATPALLARAARMAVDHTQGEVRAWLLCEHGLKWSNTRLRGALAGFRTALVPFVAELQQARLLAWLGQAEASRGRHRPVLAAGRDGIMIPMRRGGYQEASTATVSVYDRRRRRLGTVYLGQMPETKQTTLTSTLSALLAATLKAWHGPVPRLAYITDKGSAPDEYYRRVLKKMKHPRDDKPLAWEWVLDFYHVCTYIGKMAEALFGAKTKAATQWFAKMRHWLRDRRQGAAHVVRSAMAHIDRRKMTKAQVTMLRVKCFSANGVCGGVLVFSVVADEGVGEHEDLAGDGDDGNLGGFASGLEGGIEGFHGGAMADRGDGGLVETDADLGASAADVADAGVFAAVVVEGGQADEGSDRLAVFLPQLRKVGDEGAGHLGADAGDGLQDLVAGFEGLRGIDDLVHAVFEFLDLVFEEVDVLLDVFENLLGAVGCGMVVVFLDGEHADELGAAVVEFAEFGQFGRRQRPNDGGDDLGEVGDDGGIDRVGLGELAEGFGEVADLAGVGDDGRQPFGEQGADERFLVGAGRFADDPFGGVGANPGDEFGDAFVGVVEAAAEVGGSDMDVEMALGYVDADEGLAHGCPRG